MFIIVNSLDSATGHITKEKMMETDLKIQNELMLVLTVCAYCFKHYLHYFYVM